MAQTSLLFSYNVWRNIFEEIYGEMYSKNYTKKIFQETCEKEIYEEEILMEEKITTCTSSSTNFYKALEQQRVQRENITGKQYL